MDIIPIFGRKLLAVKYNGEVLDEFHRLFSEWNDPEYLETFFETNKTDITNGFYGTFSVEGAIFETYEIAECFEKQIQALSTKGEYYQLNGLNSIFKPLHVSQTKIIHLNESKARNNWLRLYALRIDNEMYIITGGAIKLTRTMQERTHTYRELNKMKECRNYLTYLGITDAKGLIEEMEI